ncbi:hypothetical protein SAMN06265337_4240 [Hymenobacter gelipurpurascens]|uniref:Uncharacterized protein n=1 Tax=Hymenobacter gelipurpurascens TaxID=89968 RepID=A0A212UHJ2_9BACT|nr:hypothetical protein [Hymenobacter gelipurpurascens]SNC77641.1 hypothetical protein SAMN06265337_4240 [Hymenobacter gelipurpurascens]
MSPKKLSSPADLPAYADHQAFIRVFQYKPLNQFDQLICVHGDRGQGTRCEMAHLKISVSAYEAIAEHFLLAERESNLIRSNYLFFGQVPSLVQHSPVLASAPE